MLKTINKHSLITSFLLSLFVIVAVDILSIPNPNVVLITVIVYLTFLYGFSSGSLSGMMVIIYSLYFFSKNHSFVYYEVENLKRIIVIIIFIPLLVLIVGSLKKQYRMKTLELEKEKEKYEQMSKTDYLTEIYNRKYFNETYVNEVGQAIHKNKTLSILLIDIDFFKQYNDTYGHIIGDDCIKKVAGAINAAKQTTDFLARYGGEEFVVICPNTQSKEAEEKAKYILRAVRSLKVQHKQSKIDDFVTVSIGVATSNQASDFEKFILLDKADQALYVAKNHGRKQVVVYEGD
jgi:diguanylate cyclase (GGDEF)-like protein